MRHLSLLTLLLLAGCGALPQPFWGDPGRMGARLVQPPPSRLAVPTPAQSLLTDVGSAAWAADIANSLADRELPALHTASRRGDWTLALSAKLRGPDVVPTYEVLDSLGVSKGTTQGAPVPVAVWAQGDPPMLKAAAQQAAPGIDSLLTDIKAVRLHDDPNSLQNRPARVYLSGVTGAPGDGDTSLAREMRRKLATYGIVVQDTAQGADYRLHCDVRTSPASNGQLKVELAWVVDDTGGERGKVTQLNEVPSASIDRYWGDVAVVVAEQAAGGIKDVLFNAAGPRVGATAAPKK